MSQTGLPWCEARILVPGNPLTTSLVFAPRDQRDRILVLRTVIAELAAIPGAVSDIAVAQRKLDWWRQALSNPQQQTHPALVAMTETGLVQSLSPGDWETLIQGVASSLNAPRFEQFEELWAHCRDIGGAAAVLEARLIDSDIDLEPFFGLGTSGYLVRVVRDLALDAREQRWLVPLDLQAEFQIDRQQVAEGRDSRHWRALVLEILARAYKHRRAALAALDPEQASRHRHLLISTALDERLARVLARRPGRILKTRVLPGALGNLYIAWRTARRYS